MAKTNQAIKPKTKLNPLWWIMVLFWAMMILYGFHLAGIFKIPYVNNYNLWNSNSNVQEITRQATIGVPYEIDFSSALIPLLPPESTGGPYTFYLGSGVGFPPFGLVLGIDGILKGTPTAASNKEFQVCVKDVGGRSACKNYHITVNSGTNSPSTTTTQPVKSLWEGTVSYKDYSDMGSIEDSCTSESVAKIRICMTRTGQNVEATYELYDSQELSQVIKGYISCVEPLVSGEDTSFSGQLDSEGNLNVEWFGLKGSVYKSSSDDDNHQITASIIDNTMNFEMLYRAVYNNVYGEIRQTEQKGTTITATKVADSC